VNAYTLVVGNINNKTINFRYKMAYHKRELLFNNVVVDTSLTLSSPIEREVSESVEILIRVRGGVGDTDKLEVYQLDSFNNTTFETKGKLLGRIELKGNTFIVEHFTIKKLSPFFKVGVKMIDGSSETPIVRCFYQKDGVSLS
jgi:hypothetical protein